MLCEKYKEALTESAFGAAELPKGVREHVDACARCGASLAAEQALTASLDAGLRSRANAAVPSNFDHRVRAALQRETTAGRKPHSMFFAFGTVAAVAVLMGIVLIPRLNLGKKNGPGNSVRRDISSASEPQLAVADGATRASIATPTRPANNKSLQISRLRKTLPPGSSLPEVLVPAGQAQLLAKYMEGVAARRPHVILAAGGQEATEVKPLQVPSIEISELVVTPLPDLSSN